MSELRARRSIRRGRPARPFLAALTIAVALLAAACTSPNRRRRWTAHRGGIAATRQAAVPPDTPAGAQLRWLIAAAAHLPLSDAQIRAHFDAAFLAQVSPALINEALLQEAITIRLLAVTVSELSTVVADVSTYHGSSRAQVLLTVDRRGLISWLRISPASTEPVPASWAGVDAVLRSVAPQVRLLVADVSNGSCQPVHSIDPGTAAPLGSAFKLYVLDALGNAVAAGKVRWNQPLTVTAQFKSLPPGELQTEPDGTRISVLDSAAKMISLSDNTAADMLIGLVGRSAVEAALTATGMASPALDRPFLTTREIFVLKLDQWPALAQRYVAADEPSRRALLASTVDRAPLPAVAAAEAWTTPRDINQPGVLRLGQRPLPGLHLPGRPGPPAGPGPDRPGALAQRRRPAARPGPVEDNLVQGRIRAGGADPGLPGHHPDRAELRRHRAGREPVAAHRPGHGDPGHSLGGQGRVHARGTRLISTAAAGRSALGMADELALAGHLDDHALALQDLQGAGGHPVRDVVMLRDRVDRGDPAGHGSLGDLVSQHLGDLLIRRYRRVRVDHMGQHR